MDSPTKEEQRILNSLLEDIEEACNINERSLAVDSYIKFDKSVRSKILDRMYRKSQQNNNQ